MDLDAATRFLARAVRAQWLPTEDSWKVHDPYPLPVRWGQGPVDLTDHRANICQTNTDVQAPALTGCVDNEHPSDDIAGVYQCVAFGRLV